MTEIRISGEDVEMAAEAGFSAEYRSRSESWNVLSELDKDSYRNVARAVLAALVVSGWRREADVLREAAASIDRLVDSYELVTRASEALMREKGCTDDDIKRRRGMNGRYMRGLLAAIDDLYEMADESDKRRASEAEQYVSAGTRTETGDQISKEDLHEGENAK